MDRGVLKYVETYARAPIPRLFLPRVASLRHWNDGVLYLPRVASVR